MAKQRQKLEVDLESLFPGETIEIGNQPIYIEPLGIKQLAVISSKLKAFFKILAEDKVTLENYNEPGNLFKIAVVLIEQFPSVLEEASNIELESLERLPIETVIEILNKVIEVNLKSKDKLEGNFKSLTEKFSLLQTETPKSKKNRKN